jgi:hypothetical protein
MDNIVCIAVRKVSHSIVYKCERNNFKVGLIIIWKEKFKYFFQMKTVRVC